MDKKITTSNLDKFAKEFINDQYSFFTEDTRSKMVIAFCEGHKEANQEVQGYRDALEKIDLECTRTEISITHIVSVVKAALSKADYKVRCLTCGQEHLNWSGSTPCCGSLSELIEPLEALSQATIELTSDEEIEEGSIDYIGGTDLDRIVERTFFKAGAKWMREQILNQNK